MFTGFKRFGSSRVESRESRVERFQEVSRFKIQEFARKATAYLVRSRFLDFGGLRFREVRDQTGNATKCNRFGIQDSTSSFTSQACLETFIQK